MPDGQDRNGTYQETVRRHVEELKRIRRYDILCARLIPCTGHDGYLLPLCDLYRDHQPLIERLAAWREANADAFPSQFPVTLEGTARWLQRGILDHEERILFLVLDRHGHMIGHVGMCDFLNERAEMEAENIVRGVGEGAPGLMSRALRALLDWGRSLGGRRIHLRVFHDNEHAIEFYRRLGFRDVGVQPLRKHREGDVIIYRPAADDDGAAPDKYFLKMVHVEM
ncbi:MAG: GNAT family N-acetyltransferase [Phycisphaerae bacterium]|nr:GNAT family N-acetyltransferase [Phycisphaerae bacterium]